MFKSNQPLVSYKDDSGPSPLLRTAGIAAGTLGFIQGHRYLMRSRPEFAEKAFNFFTKLEDRSPGNILRTFSLSELYSSYITPKKLFLNQADLLVGNDLSAMGSHLQRMVGGRLDIKSRVAEGPLKFLKNTNGSPFMKLEGTEDVQVRFFKARTLRGKASPGRIVSSSQRLGAPLDRAPLNFLKPKEVSAFFASKEPITSVSDAMRWGKGVLHNLGQAQLPKPVYKSILAEGFQPGAARIAGKPLRNLANTTERVGFLMAERAQTLLADVRLGLWKGSYNRLLHVPFKGGANKGLLNELLTKRAFPIYAGAVGLGFLDYLTNHTVSNSLIDIYQQSRVFHAKLTDHIPGARGVTDAYENVVPGKQYSPLALPLAGVTAGALWHYGKVISGKFLNEKARSDSARVLAKKGDDLLLKYFNKRSPIAKGLLVGFAAMIPFIPGMLGSRKTGRELQDIYSGQEPVPIRSGRWWDLGTTPVEGNRIKAYRPHWSVLHKSQAEKISLYGSEKEYWSHHPLLHPLKWLKDPYWLEKQHYEDRPYPITSPAFSDVPIIGPILAATVGKLVKPPVRMHPEWTDTDYDIGSTRLQPKGPEALPTIAPKQAFGLWDTVKRETLQFSEFIGLPGFITRTLASKVYPEHNPGKEIYLQGSKSMESTARRYYEKELGAMFGPDLEFTRTLGYSESIRRFIQPEPKRIEVNQISNTMPSWLPGENYFTNFKVGDPYTKIAEGYARLPGAGYEALHPEVAGLDPENYPTLTKMSILGDIAPYSVEYRQAESAARSQTYDDTESRIKYEKIAQRVQAMKDSVVRTDDRRFSREVATYKGKVKQVTSQGIELEEYPGREFYLSSVGYSAADLSAIVLGEHNNWTTQQVAEEVNAREGNLVNLFSDYFSEGSSVSITTARGALESNERIAAVFESDGVNVNKRLINEGLGQYRKDLGGPEGQAMFGWFGNLAGSISENASFTGDESRWNPLRYIPTPYHTKLWEERTALAQYQQQEVEGTRLRRWQHPIEDFVLPYARGAYRRVVGDLETPASTQMKWDLNTMSDMLDYVRSVRLASAGDSAQHGRYTSQASRTATGVNEFSQPVFVASTFQGRDATYFQRFLKEADPAERRKVLASVPTEMARALTAQWASEQAKIARAEGRNVPEIGQGGRLFTEEGLQDYTKSDTKLGYGDFQRSKEVAEFFVSHQLNLPDDPSSPLYNSALDYEDVKLKIIQQEGYDAHDFGLFDDRAALLWRKPYVDGAIRELTGRDSRSVEDVRQSVERMIMEAYDKSPKVTYAARPASADRGNVMIDVDIDQQKQLLQDMRRNPDKYQ